MDSTRFFSPTKTTCHEIKNEMHGYHIFNWEGLVYKHAAPDGQTINVDWYVEVLKWLITDTRSSMNKNAK